MPDLRNVSKPLIAGVGGLEVIAFSFVVNGASDPDGILDAKGNTIASIVHASTGTYTVTLNAPYPQQLVYKSATIGKATADVAGAATGYSANIVPGSYSSSAGTFTVETRTDDGDGTETIEDLTDNTEISVLLVAQMVNILVQS